jgi:SP family sugar:H+ symporter-like MFS transporter
MFASPVTNASFLAFSAFGGILFGYDTGVISGVLGMKDWLRAVGHPDPSADTGFAISSSTESLVVSILSAGTFFGALFGAPVGGMSGSWPSVLCTNSV